jgi:hypothetical protein
MAFGDGHVHNILAIDPATHGTAGSVFIKGVLVAATYCKNMMNEGDIIKRAAWSAKAVADWAKYVISHHPDTEEYASVDVIVVELPQIYSRGGNKTKGDPNKTCLPLAMVDGALAALFPYAETCSHQPHSWKGTTQKPDRCFDENGKEKVYVIKNRVKERLTPAEQRVIEWGNSIERSWDIADAIGVGLHHLGRFERGRVFARD